MKRQFLVCVEFDDEGEEGCRLPTETEVAAALSHSTAAEALADATGCRVSVWMNEGGDK
jgi:hypothetical protein